MDNEHSPEPKPRAASTPPSDTAKDTAKSRHTSDGGTFDYDKHIVERVDDSIWRALFNGHFRLAVRYERCGRWLTQGHSKRYRLGPHCKAKAVQS